MKVTRDVIYDLLPGYFAGEISPDTRALVDEFLQQDPEFSKMMARFRTMFRDPQPSAGAQSADGGTRERSEKETFERARKQLHKRSELRGYVIGFGFAAAFVLAVPLALGRGLQTPFLAIAVAFGMTAFISGLQLYLLQRNSENTSR